MSDMLKLAAEDADDLKAISALVQDGALKVGDMAFLPKARRFALVLNRFRWEAGRAGGRGERLRSGLRIENVLKAEAHRIRQDAKDAVLSLLATTFDPDGADGAGIITLVFSGGGAVRLHVEALEIRLDDLAGGWAAKARPAHDLD